MSIKKITGLELGLWLIALLMLFLVLSPYAIGLLVRQDYPRMLQNVARSLQGEVNIVQYEQGYFKSTIRYQLVFSSEATFEFSEEIIHGPLYLGLINQGHSPFVAAVVQGQLLATHVSGPLKPWLKNSEFVYQNVMDYNGDALIQAYLPAHKQAIQYQQTHYQMALAPISAETLYRADKQSFSGELKLSSVHLQSADGQFSGKKAELSFMLLAGQGALLEGDGLLSVQHVEYQSSKEQLVLQNLIVQLQNAQQGGQLTLGAQINVSEAFASNERFGPLEMNLSLYDLDADSVSRYLAQDNKMPDDLESSFAAFLPFFIKGAGIELHNFKLVSDLGDLQGQFLLSSDGVDSRSSADPLALLNGLNLQLSFQADKALMEQVIAWQLQMHEAQAPQTADLAVPMSQKVADNLRGLVAENWLSFDRQTYRCQLDMSQGQARLNQQAVDPLASIMSQIQSSTGVQ